MISPISPETIALIRAQKVPVPFTELVDSGLLWWINKNAFHSLGYKLTVEPGGFRLLGDGQKAMCHDNAVSNVRFSSSMELFRLDDIRKPIKFFGLNLD